MNTNSSDSQVKMLIIDGNLYKGYVDKEGLPHGPGAMTYDNYILDTIWNHGIATEIPPLEPIMRQFIYQEHYKEININGNTYIGETNKNGVPHGTGVMIYEDGHILSGKWDDGEHEVIKKSKMIGIGADIYKGETINGVPHGIGRMVYKDRIVEGRWYKGKIISEDNIMINRENRRATTIAVDNNTYKGEVDENDKPHGFGQMIYPDKMVEGKWNHGQLEHLVLQEMDIADGHYSGEVNDKGEPHGRGLLVSKDYYVYGSWDNGELSGYIERVNTGDKPKYFFYRGGWKDGKRHGYGVTEDATHVYEGEYKYDLSDGYGKFKALKSSFFYKGYYRHDKAEGPGIAAINQNNSYWGRWSGDIPNGPGSLKKANQGIIYTGKLKFSKSIYGNYLSKDGRFAVDIKYKNDNGKIQNPTVVAYYNDNQLNISTRPELEGNNGNNLCSRQYIQLAQSELKQDYFFISAKTAGDPADHLPQDKVHLEKLQKYYQTKEIAGSIDSKIHFDIVHLQNSNSKAEIDALRNDPREGTILTYLTMPGHAQILLRVFGKVYIVNIREIRETSAINTNQLVNIVARTVSDSINDENLYSYSLNNRGNCVNAANSCLFMIAHIILKGLKAGKSEEDILKEVKEKLAIVPYTTLAEYQATKRQADDAIYNRVEWSDKVTNLHQNITPPTTQLATSRIVKGTNIFYQDPIVKPMEPLVHLDNNNQTIRNTLRQRAYDDSAITQKVSANQPSFKPAMYPPPRAYEYEDIKRQHNGSESWAGRIKESDVVKPNRSNDFLNTYAAEDNFSLSGKDIQKIRQK